MFGSLKIDSVKVTSWDPTTNNYAITNGSRDGDILHPGAPRPFITIEKGATGTTDITNSEIAYLGFEKGDRTYGGDGLNYYGGDGSFLKNNDIHDLYFGFYSAGIGHIVVENNIISNSGHYGFDPHTGTHDMIVRNNTLYDNNGTAIICSLNCYNILIENNKVHDNSGDGITFSRNMTKSIVRNNIVYNEPKGIYVSESHGNQVYNNAISKSEDGIHVSTSSGNKIFNNTITDSTSSDILIKNGSSENTFSNNKIISSTSQGLRIIQDSTSTNNAFSNNRKIASKG